MGRAKLKMELIEKEKSRSITFNKRKEGLIRKMHELTTLCDVNGCMIIYDPKLGTGPSEPDIWPQNRDEVFQMIDMYKTKKKDSGTNNFGLKDFFHERNNKIEGDFSKIRRENQEARYPTPFMDGLTEGQLRQFAVDLSFKAQLAKAKLEELKMKRLKELAFPNAGHGVQSPFYPPHPLMHDIRIPAYYPTKDHRLLINGGDDQFGASSSNAPFKRQVIYEPTPTSIGGYGDHWRTTPLLHYYAPMLSEPQLPIVTDWENHDIVGHEDMHAHEKKMKNHGLKFI